MRYSTRLYGTPYGRDGERSEDTQRPMERAAGILYPGQTLDCFDAANDPHQRRPLRRFHHSMEHGVDEVELGPVDECERCGRLYRRYPGDDGYCTPRCKEEAMDDEVELEMLSEEMLDMMED